MASFYEHGLGAWKAEKSREKNEGQLLRKLKSH